MMTTRKDLGFWQQSALLAVRMSYFVGPYLLAWGVWQHFTVVEFASSSDPAVAQVVQVDTLVRDGVEFFRPLFLVLPEDSGGALLEFRGTLWTNQNSYEINDRVEGFYSVELGRFKSASELAGDREDVITTLVLGVLGSFLALAFTVLKYFSNRAKG